MPGMHRIAASVLGLGLVAAVACGGKGGERAAVAVTGAEVGTVLEVEGEVTASRAGQARPLVVGQRVHDDDVVATGGGRVAIQLDKNHVVWRLGPRLTQQVAQSSAWSAPMAQADVVAATDEHSAAAGRRAEREAADTAASAVEAKGAEKLEKNVAPPPAAATTAVPAATTAAPEVPAMPAPTPPPPPPPTPAPDPLAALDPPGAGLTGGVRAGDGAGGGGAGSGRADADAVRELGATATVTADDGVATDRRGPDTEDSDAEDLPAKPTFAPRVGAPAPPAAWTIGKIWTRGPLTSTVVRDQVVAARAPLAACAVGVPSGASFVWSFRIGADGAVSGTAIKGASAALVRCVAAVATGWTFAKAKQATTAKVAFTAP